MYFGNVTGAAHQVTHVAGSHPDELLRAHSLSCMLRTCLFPHNRARQLNGTPSPQPFFQALCASFTESLLSESFVLPTMEMCRVEDGLQRRGAERGFNR